MTRPRTKRRRNERADVRLQQSLDRLDAWTGYKPTSHYIRLAITVWIWILMLGGANWLLFYGLSGALR